MMERERQSSQPIVQQLFADETPEYQFAASLQAMSKAQNVSLNELSTLIGMERKYISQCLIGKRIPPIDILKRLEIVLRSDDGEFTKYRPDESASDNAFSEWYQTFKADHQYKKIVEVGVPYDSLVIPDNRMRGIFLIKNTVVLHATDGKFKENGGIYCVLIDGKRYIRLVHALPNNQYSVSAAGCFSYEAPQYYNKDEITIIGEVLIHYHDHRKGKGIGDQ